MQTTRRLFLAAPLLAAPAVARAQAQPLRILVPAPPGGPTDILARVLAERAGVLLGRSVVVENRPGAGGVIGSEALARAPADGNTVGIGHNQTHASNQWMMARLPFHVVDSFAPVALMGSVHHVLVVPANAPSQTLAQLIERGRTGDLNYASSQAGSASHVISEVLVRRNGMRATHVPFNGAAPAATATVAGQVDFFTATLPTVAGLLREGRLRGLAIGAPARLDGFADLPTAREAGQPEPFVDSWFGVFAPRGTPAPLVAELAAAMIGVLDDAQSRRRLETAGFVLTPKGPEAFGAFQQAEVVRWEEMIRLTGVRIDS